jgi:hypothetical protein
MAIPPGLSNLLGSISLAKIGEKFSEVKGKIFPGGGEGGAVAGGGPSTARGLTGIVENFLQDGRINGLTPLQWITRVGIQLIIVALIFGAISVSEFSSTSAAYWSPERTRS